MSNLNSSKYFLFLLPVLHFNIFFNFLNFNLHIFVGLCKKLNKEYVMMSRINIKNISLISLLLLTIQATANDYSLNVPWTVIGAGPAGISVVGILLDSGVQTNQIVWIDLEFNVGRLGKYYQNVPGNAKVSQYITFLKACNTFGFCKSSAIDFLFNMPLDKTPELRFIIEPLYDITQYLKTKTIALQDELMALDFHDNQWFVDTKTTGLRSDHVILATGSHPRDLLYEGKKQIPLDQALDKKILAANLTKDDIVGVVGSAHSALLIVKYLTELPVKAIYNFYKKPIVYPTPVANGVAWQEAGIKGELATWTQNVLTKNPPINLKRIFNTPQAMKRWLARCTKIIYAAGFDRNELPSIGGDQTLYDNYDCSAGVIGPRLFGVGIAFPEKRIDPLGNVEYLVGLPFFMPYIQKIVPQWMQTKFNRSLYEFNELFTITIL